MRIEDMDVVCLKTSRKVRAIGHRCALHRYVNCILYNI